jgi:hypothetical protein
MGKRTSKQSKPSSRNSLRISKLNQFYKSPTEKEKGQCSLDIQLSHQQKLVSLRSCPNSPEHVVEGDPFKMGGRAWVCRECGLEWRASLRTGYLKYYKIRENGSVKEISRIELFRVAEARQAGITESRKVKNYLPPVFLEEMYKEKLDLDEVDDQVNFSNTKVKKKQKSVTA